jgi:hypothetical protein
VKQWIDLVLAFGWAYGPGGVALRGKTLFHVVTSGGAAAAYQADGFHGYTLAEFLRPLERTTTLCGMTWLPPLAIQGWRPASSSTSSRATSVEGREAPRTGFETAERFLRSTAAGRVGDQAEASRRGGAQRTCWTKPPSGAARWGLNQERRRRSGEG